MFPLVEGGAGLNRTSVGLKLWFPTPTPPTGTRLNRTSVGLKLPQLIVPVGVLDRPQSNQRGIETGRTKRSNADRGHASIEPAWD